jgi:hypothetical protein
MKYSIFDLLSVVELRVEVHEFLVDPVRNQMEMHFVENNELTGPLLLNKLRLRSRSR